MCGIVGIMGRGTISPERLSAGITALCHRGPDGEGVFLSDDGHTGLGHTRLAIIDLSAAGHQPMHGSDGRYVITYNGEIYNFADIRRELETSGIRFRGHSDTEVLLEGFAKFGPAVLEKLNGIFAFAIYDRLSKELFLARDPLGIKPLYFSQTQHGFGFASEIKSLRAAFSFDMTLDHVAIARYLTFLWCPGERTPLLKVKKLDPGSALLVREGIVSRSWQYWSAPAYEPRRDWTAAQCAGELKQQIDRAVSRQMISDAPLGAFLSGGLDSSAVAAAMVHNAPNTRFFTIDSGSTEEGTTEDLPYAQLVAAHLKARLDVVRADSHSMATHVSEMVHMLDEPLADPACLNVYFISKLARDSGIKVLLGGTGGDDLFSGYRRHVLLAQARTLSRIPGPLRKRLRTAIGSNQRSALKRRIVKALDILENENDRSIPASFAFCSDALRDDLLSSELKHELAGEDVYAPMMELLSAHQNEPAVEKSLLLDRRFFLGDHNLTYTDKMAMAAGVEVRVPLIDLELVHFAAQIPNEWKLKGLTTKWIFKESQRGILPASVIDRPKTGFGAPLREWMKSELRELTNDLLSRQTLVERGLFNADAVMKLRDDDLSGRVDGSYPLFSIMCIELWCRSMLDGEMQRTAHAREIVCV